MVFCKLFEQAKILGQKQLTPTPEESAVYIIYEDEHLSESIRHFNNLIRKGAKGFVASPLLPSALLNRNLMKPASYVLFIDDRSRLKHHEGEIVEKTPHLETALTGAKRFIDTYPSTVILFDAFRHFMDYNENEGFYGVMNVLERLYDYMAPKNHSAAVVHKSILLVPIPVTKFTLAQKPNLKRSIPATILE